MPHNFTSIVLRAEGWTRAPLAPLCFTPFKRKSMRKQRKQGQRKQGQEARGSKDMYRNAQHPAAEREDARRCKDKMQGQRCKDMHRKMQKMQGHASQSPQHPAVERYHKA